MDVSDQKRHSIRRKEADLGKLPLFYTIIAAQGQKRVAFAEAFDTTSIPDGMSLPEELRLRENRLAAMATAKAMVTARGSLIRPR